MELLASERHVPASHLALLTALFYPASRSPSLELAGAWFHPSFLMIVAPYTEGLSGHSSTAVQPGDHCSLALGPLRSAVCLPSRPCQAVFTFLTLVCAVPGRPLSLTQPPCSSWSFQWLASEAKPLSGRKPLCPSAPLLPFLGIIPPLLLSSLLGTSLQEQ